MWNSVKSKRYEIEIGYNSRAFIKIVDDYSFLAKPSNSSIKATDQYETISYTFGLSVIINFEFFKD